MGGDIQFMGKVANRISVFAEWQVVPEMRFKGQLIGFTLLKGKCIPVGCCRLRYGLI